MASLRNSQQTVGLDSMSKGNMFGNEVRERSRGQIIGLQGLGHGKTCDSYFRVDESV